jgi:hypothetical protein
VSEIADIVEGLNALRYQLSAQIEDLISQRDRAAAALVALGAPEPTGRAVVAPIVAEVVKGSAPKPSRPGKVTQTPKTCPDCGRVCGSATGLAAHRRHAHPAAKSTAPLGPLAASVATPAPTAPVVAVKGPATLPDGKVLVCTEKDCGREFGSVHALIAHTNMAHNREPWREEKWPVQPQGAA